jgi:uncharacterized protein (TIGR02646 family)
MRPARRGASPQAQDFEPCTDALPYLASRLGPYCSYCERRVVTQLAVEHIQPKDPKGQYAHLAGCWNNFLLACVNCNSTKGNKPIVLADVLLPDRDNTFVAFDYSPDGTVKPAPGLTPDLTAKARNTLALTGLDKRINEVTDENGKRVALDRVSQRFEAWAIAEESKADIDANPGNEALRKTAVRTALGYGHFSVWMAIFSGDADMRNRLIDAFAGVRESGCFDPATALPVSPAPNPDNLADGGKL